MNNPNRPPKTQQARTSRDPRKPDYYELSPHMQAQGMKGRNEGSIMLKNGHAKANGGYRALVITAAGAVRGVQRVTRNGYVPDRGTWQICHTGDFIFHVARTPKSTRLGELDQKVFTFDEVAGIKEFTDYGSLKAKWDMVPAVLAEWLDAYSNKEESSLPAGWGWDGDKSTEEVNKDSRIRTMLRGIRADVIEEVVAAAMLSNSQAMPTNWKSADPRIPADIDNPVEVLVVDGETHVDRHVIWVLHCSGKRTSLRDAEPTSGLTVKMVEGVRTEIVHANKVRQMPKDVIRAMRISLGNYSKDGKSYGVSWKLFAKPMTKRPPAGARHNRLDNKSIAAAVHAADPVVQEAASDETFALDA